MNIEQAIKRIKQFGLSCHNHVDYWLVHYQNGHSERYTDRELTHFAASLKKSNWKHDESKIRIGPGGVNCG